MNESSTITSGIAKPTLRKMSYEELPNKLLSSLRRSRTEGGNDPREAGRRREHVRWVAELQGRSAGVAVCVLVRPTAASAGTNPLQRLAPLFASLLGSHCELPLYVEVLDVVVKHDPACAVVAHALLRRLVEELQRSWGRIPVVVPESHRTAQLFLRSARYKAVQVFRGYYGHEDGYLMTDEVDHSPQKCPSHGGRRWEELPCMANTCRWIFGK